jgi:hypothetical protein
MSPSAPLPHDAAEELLAHAVCDYSDRRAAGESVRPQEYQARLGDQYAEFLTLVETEAALWKALRPPEASPLPRDFGPYVLKSELGRGGVGVVYEAEEKSLQRTVALKILRTGIDTDEIAKRRIRQEARMAAQVRHESVVSIFGCGEVQGQVYIAMDLVPGEPLSHYLKRGERPEPRELAGALSGVARALQALHEKGVFHRDVKPANLIVRPDGRFVLTDFGLARAVDSTRLTQSGHAVGTPLYMSPEHIRTPHAVDARSDVYGLGAVLYEALTGRPPFQSTDQAAIYNQILRERPVKPSTLAPGVPADLERVALKALEKDPAHRYATAAEMAADLERHAAGQRTVGRPRSLVARGASAVRRHALPIAAGLLVAFAGAWMWTHRDATLEVDGLAEEQLEVVVDGQVRGRAPVTMAIAPGRRVIEVRRSMDADRWEPIRRERDFAPGETYALDGNRVFPKERPTASDLADIGRRIGLAPPRALDDTRATTRSGAAQGEPACVLIPRGDVRVEDLGVWMVEIDPEQFVAGTRLVVLRGNEALVEQDLIAPANGSLVCGEFPAKLAGLVRVGDKLRVRCVEPGARSASNGRPDVRVVAVPELAADLARADERLSDARHHLREHFRAARLEQARLYTAAFVEARQVALADREDKAAHGVLLRALVMGERGEALLAEAIQGFVFGGQPAPDLCGAGAR